MRVGPLRAMAAFSGDRVTPLATASPWPAVSRSQNIFLYRIEWESLEWESLGSHWPCASRTRRASPSVASLRSAAVSPTPGRSW